VTSAGGEGPGTRQKNLVGHKKNGWGGPSWGRDIIYNNEAKRGGNSKREARGSELRLRFLEKGR